jgi:hypothetical protein
LIDGVVCDVDLCEELLCVCRNEVGKFDVFDLVPTLFDNIQLRRIGRKSLEVKPIGMMRFVKRLQAFVALQIIPNQNDFALKIFVQLFEKTREFRNFRTSRKGRIEKLHDMTCRRDRHEADGSEMSPFFRLDKNVRHVDRRPTLPTMRLERMTGFIEKDDGPAVFTRFFLSAAIDAAAMFRPLEPNIFSTA